MSGAAEGAAFTVVGDCMLDRHWGGRVTRISSEAPVPIVHMRAQTDRLGGAANVALNVRKLGARECLLGAVGDDSHGRSLRELLRVDFEQALPKDLSTEDARRFRADLSRSACVVFSDYAKGALREVQDMIQAAKRSGNTGIVDRKGDG